MRPDCVCVFIDHDKWTNRRMKRLSGKGGSQNMLVDHLFQYRISPWPKTAKKRGFCTGVTDGRMDGWTDGRTDPLIEMRSWRTHLKMGGWRMSRRTETVMKLCQDNRFGMVYISVECTSVVKYITLPPCSSLNRGYFVFIPQWEILTSQLTHVFPHSCTHEN